MNNSTVSIKLNYPRDAVFMNQKEWDNYCKNISKSNCKTYDKPKEFPCLAIEEDSEWSVMGYNILTHIFLYDITVDTIAYL